MSRARCRVYRTMTALRCEVVIMMLSMALLGYEQSLCGC